MASVVHIRDSRSSSANGGRGGGGVRLAVDGHSPSQPNSSLGSSNSPIVWSKPSLADDIDGVLSSLAITSAAQAAAATEDAADTVDVVEVVVVPACVSDATPTATRTTAMAPSSQPPPLRAATMETELPLSPSSSTPLGRRASHTPVERSKPAAAEGAAHAYETRQNGDGQDGDVKQLPTPVVARRNRRSPERGRTVNGEHIAKGRTAPNGSTCDHDGGGGGGDTPGRDEHWGTFLDTPCTASDQPTPTPHHPQHHYHHHQSASEAQDDPQQQQQPEREGGLRLVATRNPVPARGQVPPHAMPSPPQAGAAAAAVVPHNTTHTLDAPIVTAADYSDRQRLLYHITFLATQVQRAQLQLQEQQRTLAIVRAAAAFTERKRDEDAAAAATANEADVVHITVPRASATAAVLAARDEAEMLDAFEQSLALFDPLIAQTQINRLDNALAQVGLLREAELQQLREAEAQLERVREERNLFASQVDVLGRRAEKAEAEAHALRAQLTVAQQEVVQLRSEDVRLSRQLAELRGLTNDDPFSLQAIRVRGAAQNNNNSSSSNGHTSNRCRAQIDALIEEEAAARQDVLQELFWDPLCIAFDAGLTWVAECDARSRDHPLPITSSSSTSVAVRQSDADLMLLRHQQDELASLRGQLDHLTHRLRMESSERARWRELYEAEQRRSEMQASDFLDQLRHAYDQVRQDRELILEQVQREMEQEARQAFSDGRLYEQRRVQSPALSSSSSPQQQQQQRRGRGGAASSRTGWTAEDEESDSDVHVASHRSPRDGGEKKVAHRSSARRPPPMQRRGVSPYSAASSPSSRVRNPQ